MALPSRRSRGRGLAARARRRDFDLCSEDRFTAFRVLSTQIGSQIYIVVSLSIYITGAKYRVPPSSHGCCAANTSRRMHVCWMYTRNARPARRPGEHSRP
eukprot:scaffold68660_cov54-Phaeocystis_antarctica.AAC.1